MVIEIPDGLTFHETIGYVRQELLKRSLAEHETNAGAARALGLKRTYLQRLLRQAGLRRSAAA